MSTHTEQQTGWTEVGDTYHDAGEVGGDVQVGPASSRRFQFGPVAGRYLLVTEYTYASDWDGFRGTEPIDGEDYRYAVDEQTEYLICTDPDDPGGTEVDRRIEYGQGSYFGYASIERATEEAHRMIARCGIWQFEHYDPTEELTEGMLK